MTEDELRAKFEATRKPRTDLAREKLNRERYNNPVVQACWEAFQAAYALLAPEMRDAARYRLLRKGDNDKEFLQFSEHARDGTDDVWLLREEKLDEALDAAIAAMETKHATE